MEVYFVTDQHPITPPPELVQQWIDEEDGVFAEHIATQAANWGADTELEACRLWVSENCDIYSAVELIQCRRPKPPSLKEQALDAWIRLRNEVSCEKVDGDLDCLLRALESLPD